MYFSCICQPRLEPPAYPVVQHFMCGVEDGILFSLSTVWVLRIQFRLSMVWVRPSVFAGGRNANRCEPDWLAFFDAECLGFSLAFYHAFRNI